MNHKIIYYLLLATISVASLSHAVGGAHCAIAKVPTVIPRSDAMCSPGVFPFQTCQSERWVNGGCVGSGSSFACCPGNPTEPIKIRTFHAQGSGPDCVCVEDVGSPLTPNGQTKGIQQGTACGTPCPE